MEDHCLSSLSIVLNVKLEQIARSAMVMFLFGIIFLNSYSISRAVGAMYQFARENAIVRVS